MKFPLYPESFSRALSVAAAGLVKDVATRGRRSALWSSLLVGMLVSATAQAQTSLPGRVQAESYTSMAGVQLEATTDSGGGQNVGWIEANDWMVYRINPTSSGWYDVRYRVASATGGGKVVLGRNGQDLNTDTDIPNTGGWQNWVTVNSRVYLDAGVQDISVFARTGGWNINWVEFSAQSSWAPLPQLKQSGRFWVDPSGNRVNLRGTNLGNWLIQEFWMMNQGMRVNNNTINDQCTLEGALAGRFGDAEKERLMKVFRDSWMTPRDWDHLKAMGMNVVRLPFLYSLIEDEYNPYNLRPDAWVYLDRAIDEAEKRGIYVILDLHGAVGGQAGAPEQHDGCVGAANMWTNNSYRDRTKWLWDMIASRYRGRGAVAAYDLLNEPWGTDPTTLANFSYELFNVVRAKDPDHIIILAGHNSGIDAYGNPNSRGLTNVAMEMHFYPGLWGWNEVAYGQAQADMHLNWLHCNPNGTGETCDWNNRITGLNVPFIIGEFQPWTLTGTYGGPVTRKTYDMYNHYGWAATSWSYKTVSFGGSNGNTDSWGWGMVSNSSNGGTFGTIDVGSANATQIENWFRQFATQPLVRNASITNWMNYKPAVGSRIEAEHHTNHSGVRAETTTDAGGGLNASFMDTNDWMSYSLNIPTTGWYNLQYRIASPNSTGQLVLSRNGTDLATNAVPNTGGWQNWATITNSVYLTAGQQDLAIYVRNGGWNINWWSLTPQ